MYIFYGLDIFIFYFLESCEQAANCSPYATCTYDEVLDIHECKCLPGFEGDGYDCVRPTCILGVCWCPDGYLYVNEKCERSVISGESPGIIHFAVKVIFNTPPINFAI